jgi:hypothetical protein
LNVAARAFSRVGREIPAEFATIARLSARATAATIVLLGAAVALAGDATDVASGTTRYACDELRHRSG